MKIKKLVSIFIICQSLSGCGLAQKMESDKQYKEQKKEAVFSSSGMKALEYVLKDDKITASEGGESLCKGGCSLNDAIDKANNNALGITAFYVAIHDYDGKAPSLYKIEDPSVRNPTMAEILNRFSAVFGSSILSDTGHSSDLYRDFSKDREFLGLNNVSELDFKKSIAELYKRRNEFVISISSMRDQARYNAEQIEVKRMADYDKVNPEFAVTELGNVISIEKAPALRKAFNSMPFVTRTPNSTDPRQVYAKIGKYKLTLNQVEISTKELLTECQRVSAYTGLEIENPCFNQVGNGLSNFASIIKNKSIPDLTKNTALGEATFGRIIDFDHAARLAKMHQEMCSRKNNSGYAAMVTVAVPCSGHGDVLYISVAEKAGLL
ncbi:phage gpG-like protein [Serratia sp. PL17]|uniref:hypothetical protein n=1 Tax=Serratia sp. PL17 TaxID=2806582 RepID=UPI001AEA103E|nr:hypothetical protein [Serratia sp. PL17]MBP1132612.1 phage gpG-like protein [Serratia sp. PL17]